MVYRAIARAVPAPQFRQKMEGYERGMLLLAFDPECDLDVDPVLL